MKRQDVFNWIQEKSHVKRLGNGEWNASITLGLDINETAKNIYDALIKLTDRICKSEYLTKMLNQRLQKS